MESHDGSEDSESETWKQDIEIALYSQLHFEQNTDYLNKENDVNNPFDITVMGDSQKGYKAKKTTSDLIVNRSIGQDDSECEETESGNKLQKKRKQKRRMIDHYLDSLECGFDADDAGARLQSLDSDLDSLYGVLDEEDMSNPGDIQINVKRNSRPLLEIKVADDDKWKISVDDIRQGRNEGRYHKRFRCQNCNEQGHISKNCTKPKKQKVCAFCSETGHLMLSCPHSLCYNCDIPGHNAKDCPRPRRNTHAMCHRCQMPGHNQYKCPDLWRQFHQTTVPGKITPKKRKARSLTYCYNCAGDDHLGHECEEDRMSRYVKVATPYVCQYDKSFGAYGIEDLEGTEKEPPSKKQKTETAVSKAKQVSAFIIGKNRKDSNTVDRNKIGQYEFEPRNKKGSKTQWQNFDKMHTKSPKTNQNKISMNKTINWPNNFQNRGFSNTVQSGSGTSTQLDVDFPRGGSVINHNGFRSRFGKMNSWNAGTKLNITVKCKGDSLQNVETSNSSNIRFSEPKTKSSHIRFSDSKKPKAKRQVPNSVCEQLDEDSLEFANHQVHDNEWWNKKKKKRNKPKRKKNKMLVDGRGR